MYSPYINKIIGILVLSSLLIGSASEGLAQSQPAANGTTIGVASYYGAKYHGRKTASGAVFDMNKLTAAHQTLSFGQRVRVTNLANGRSVEVVINDRGPFVGNRSIDLSQAAARKLNMIRSGLAKVRVEILKS